MPSGKKEYWLDTLIWTEDTDLVGRSNNAPSLIKPVILCFHWKPKRNLGFETELPVSIYLFENELK